MVARGSGGEKFDGDKVAGLTTFAPRRPAAMQPCLGNVRSHYRTLNTQLLTCHYGSFFKNITNYGAKNQCQISVKMVLLKL